MIHDLYSRLKKLNVNIQVLDDQLDIKAAKGTLTEELLNEIRSQKEELIEFIRAYKKKKKTHFAINPLPEQPDYELSSSQRRLWVLSRFSGAGDYNAPGAYVFEGNVDVQELSFCFRSLLVRHESLRTVFRTNAEGQVRQVIVPVDALGCELGYKDMRGCGQAQIEEQVQQQYQQGFDLSQGPLVRAVLYQVSGEQYVFAYVLHHIISDGWSMEILMRELLELYNARVNGRQANLSPLRIQYKDYAAWQQQQLSGGELQQQRRYWLEQLGGELPVLALATDHPRPAMRTYNGSSVKKILAATTSEGLQELVRVQGITLFMSLAGAVNALLYKYTGQSDIIIGTTIAGRQHADLEDQIGFYVNALALRTRLDSSASYRQLLDTTREVLVGAYEHQGYPFDELVGELHMQRDRSRHPLFDVLVELQAQAGSDAQEPSLSGIGVRRYDAGGKETAKFDLRFVFSETAGGLEVMLEYNTDLYNRSTIELMVQRLEVLLGDLVQNPGKSIQAAEYLTAAEKEKILGTFNKPARQSLPYEGVLEAFRRRVQGQADAVAIQYGGQSFSYGWLDEQSGRLAAHLKNTYGAGRGTLVGILLERSEKMIVALLAVLKSGAAYVPIDPGYPRPGKQYIIEDTGLQVLLTQTSYVFELDYYSGELFAMDVQLEGLPSATLKTDIEPQDTAYVIYTSGSTGVPKGCGISHANLWSYIGWANGYYFEDESKGNFGLFTSLSFDLTVTSIYCSLTRGRTLKVYGQQEELSDILADSFSESSGIDSIKLTPSHIGFLKHLNIASTTMQCAIVGGEEITIAHISQLKQASPGIKVYNEYGPTETTVGCIVRELEAEEPVLIGTPVSGTGVYIVNEGLSLCGIGIVGEICISGDGVGQGYLHQRELTNEKFIPDPFRVGQRMYKTGDLGKWMADGNIAFAGRKDEQVKIRGYRVEPGEIESALSRHAQVRSAAVITRQSGTEKMLVAYVQNDPSLTMNELKGYLSESLPQWMVPAHIVSVDALPLTINGKVDKKALSNYEIAQTGKDYIAPVTETEKKLAAIWSEILDVDSQKIGLMDDFFVLGGHSLKVTHLASQLHKDLDAKLALQDLFVNSVLQAQAALIDQSTKTSFAAIRPVEPQPDYPVSSSQRRLWVLSRFEQASNAYHMAGSYAFDGQFHRGAFTRAFDSLVERHESLRTVFKENEEGEIRQYILAPAASGVALRYFDLRNGAIHDEAATRHVRQEFEKPFDLSAGPLVRASLYQLSDERFVFAYVMHHIISDGLSMQILVKELLQLYSAFIQNRENALTPLRIQYKDYAAWQQQQLSGDNLQKHKQYWLRQLEGELPVLEFADKLRPSRKTYTGATVNKVYSKALSKKLKKLNAEGGHTLFMSLLATTNALLYRYTSQEDIIIGTSVASRDHADLHDQIGFYVNTLALRTRFSGTDCYNELLEKTKKVTLEAYDHQVYPFDHLVDDLQLERDMSRNVLFNVMLVLETRENNNDDQVPALPHMQVTRYQAGEQLVSKFDLTFFFSELGDHLHTSIVYNPDIFFEDTILRLSNHFGQLLEAVMQNPWMPLDRIDYLSDEEKKQLLVQFNNTQPASNAGKTIVDLFREQARRSAGNAAVVFGSGIMSFRELDEKSDRLAHYLRTSAGIVNNDIVGIVLDRSAHMIVALLGIMKAGGAYVAIDPENPAARKEFIFNDTAAKAIITQADYIFDISYYSGNIFCIDIQLDGWEMPAGYELPSVHTGDLAYLVYTSGSTGRPKGVMISHRSLVDYCDGIIGKTNLRDCKTFGLVSTIAADLGNTVLYPSLITGGALHIFSTTDVMNAQAMSKVNLDCIKIVPSHWKALQEGENTFIPDKCLVFGGEQLTADVIGLLKLHGATCKVFNHYGPSETTVGKLVKEIDMGAANPAISLGTPFCDTEVYIVDARQNLLPRGLPGEICIAGEGLSKGYLNNPELTAQKFIDNPFREGRRMYRTGDVGRWLPDGTIEFIGRIDNQVKIRGYRIEPGEIENALREHEGVDMAVVIIKENEQGEKDLLAYIGSRIGVGVQEIRAWLTDKLPVYMVPSNFVVLSELPLTANGKIDRKKLPEAGNEDESFVAPRTETEIQLAAIWTEILGKEKIGIHDDFFRCGGHSLKVARLASQVQRKLQVRVDFVDLFSHSILEEQAQLIDRAKRESFVSIPVVEEQPDYELSSSQRRLWVLSQFEEANIGYNVPAVYQFEGNLDVAALSYAFTALLHRHESLRTVFCENDRGEVRQRILPADATGFSISCHDMRAEPLQEEKVRSCIARDFIGAFDLSCGPLLRAGLYQLGDSRWLLSCVTHHIISDGWSMEILIRELLELYNARVNGREAHLSPLRIQYKDYVAWQQHQLSGQLLQDHKSYWLQQFEGELPVLELATDHPRPATRTYNGGVINKVISTQVSESIKRLSQQQGGTLFMGLLSAVNVLLYRYTGQQDIIIGTPMAGREHADLENQIGVYINTLALRTQFAGSNSYTELLQNVRRQTLGAYDHQAYPFDELVEQLQLKRDLSRHPLFDVTIVLQNAGAANKAPGQLSGLQVLPYSNIDKVTSVFDLVFSFTEFNNGLQLNIIYNSDLHQPQTVARMADHFELLLNGIVTHADQPISQLELVTAAEKELLLNGFNDTDADWPQTTLVHLLEEQVLHFPNNIAVSFESRSLTYAQLNEQANRLARYLQHHYAIQPDQLVGIRLQRGEWMIITMLAVLKAGGAYLPIDPGYPAERIDYMISDSQCRLVIDENELQAYQSLAVQYESTNLPIINQPGHLAYVIYTSGTTGFPKGSMIEHRNVVRLFKTSRPLFDFGPSDVWTMFHSYCFDFSVWEMYGALLFGGRLVLVSSLTARDPQAYLDLLRQEKVTVLNQTPSSFYNIAAREQENADNELCLRYIIFGGEALSPARLRTWKEKYPGVRFINMYGITETTVHVTYKEIGQQQIDTNSSNIGKPIPTLRCYVLDKQGNLLPWGIPGELYVGGAGVSRGYLNKKELTAQRFIDSPFGKQERLYRSGDTVKMLANGEMEYFGRMDNQVKVRGYRIELAEVERALQSYPGMGPVAITVWSNRNAENELIAYFTGENNFAIADLRSWMEDRLPVYMVPGHFIQLPSLPLTTNGKLDKKALPLPEDIGTTANASFIAPRNETEQKLAAAWQEILGRESISITDNFFELGGHSLKIARLLNLLRKEFEVNIAMKDLFTATTIEAQARLIESARKKMFSAIVPVAEQPGYVLSSAQHRLWVLSQIEAGNIGYNIPGAYVFEGSPDTNALSQALQQLIARHEILRTVFRANEQEEVRQFILSPNEAAVNIAYHDLRHVEAPENRLKELIQKEFSKPFHLDTGPLIRASLYQVETGKYIFTYVLHHIVCDGPSMDIMIEELLANYRSLIAGDIESREPLRIQYKDYAAWQQAQLRGKLLQEHKTYWLQQFEGELPVLELVSDKTRPSVKTYNGGLVSTNIGKERARALKTLSQQSGATLYMSLLAVVNALLYKYTGQQDIIVGSPVASREHADLQQQIGFYVNTLPLRARFSGDHSFNGLLSHIKQITVDAFEHQAYPFDDLVEALKLQRDMSRSVLFDVLVALQINSAGPGGQEPLPGLKVSSYQGVSKRITKFDLSFGFIDNSDELCLNLEYNTDIYDRPTIEKLALHFEKLLDAVIAAPSTSINRLEFLAEEERQKLVERFNDTEVAYDSEKTIVDLFEEQVEKTPDNIAIIFEGRSLTYRELNEKVNQFASYLRKSYNIQPDDLVALKLERSEWMIFAILGTLKAGAAYVPIDVAYPQERIDYMIEDSQCKACLDWVELSSFNKKADRYDKANPGHINKPQDLVYVIYTSGTTGNPKGVMIEHRNLAARIAYLRRHYQLTEKDNLIFYRSYSFDAAIEEYLLPLLIGAKCCIAPPGFNRDIVSNIISFTEKHAITKINMPPALLGELIRSVNQSDLQRLASLRIVVSGGDKLTMDLVNAFLETFPITLYNAYGPTENTDDSTNWKAEARPELAAVPIGRPVPNSQVYILNDHLGLVPIGASGEMYVAGAGLARGYLNRPELTAEKFIANPFRAGERMYKTGDLGRWLPDGNIEFLGRKDDQVKIRGHRIEPGEIETLLTAYPDVESALVAARPGKSGEKELVAYLVSKTRLELAAMRSYLANALPTYMLPAHFVQLQALPLNSNGKIDRKALPDPEGIGMETGVEYVAPRNDMEQCLVEVCCEVLKKKSIGVLDDFFMLGGDSIKSIQVSSRLRKKGYSLPIQDILMYPVIEQMAARMRREVRVSENQTVAGPVPLGPIQQIFFAHHPVNNHHYNQSVLLYSRSRIDADALKSSLQKIIAHHDTLRMNFRHTDNGWIQEIGAQQKDVELEIIPGAGEEARKAHADRLQESFDLANGLLFKAALFTGDHGDYILLMAHHLVIDGVSWRILFEDLSTVYQQYLAGEAPELPAKTDSFSYWQQALHSYANGEALQKEKSYWSAVELLPVQPLPLEYPQGDNKVGSASTSSFMLSSELTTQLLTKCYKAYHTETNDILMTALGLSLRKTFSIDKILVALEGHGREDIGGQIDTSRTIGWFTTTYPVVLDMKYSSDITRQLIEIKETLHRIPNKGIGYGLLRYHAGCNYQLEPAITFNYLGDFGSGIETQQGDELFQFSGDYRGREIAADMDRETVLAVSGMVVEGRMRLSVTYSNRQFAAATVEQLVAHFRQELINLIELLSAEKKVYLTPVDLTYKGLTVEQLEKLNQTL